jgi:hypothetical protein
MRELPEHLRTIRQQLRKGISFRQDSITPR